MDFPYSDLESFVSPDCDRKRFVLDNLKKSGVKAVVMPVCGKNHIYVVFPPSAYNPAYRIKTVIAHYDRMSGSPGANDNSFAVIMLMKWAEKLNRNGCVHNVRLIFTDGEELGGLSTSSKEQGAYSLAQLFKKLGITNDDVFVFDCMGRGCFPVIARQVLPAGTGSLFVRRFERLYHEFRDFINSAVSGSFAELPVSYSDNAGFIACGIPAVALTMLPVEEAVEYSENLKKFPELEQFVVNKKIPHGMSEENFDKLVPYTWRILHSPNDSISSITDGSSAVFERILDILTSAAVPARR